MTPEETIAVVSLAFDEAGLDRALLEPLRGPLPTSPPPAPPVDDDGEEVVDGIAMVRIHVHYVAMALVADETRRISSARGLVEVVLGSTATEASRRTTANERVAQLAAASDRRPGTLLDILLPQPRAPSRAVIEAVIAELSDEELRELLSSPEPRDRLVAIRWIAARKCDAFAGEVVRLAMRDPEECVRLEAFQLANRLSRTARDRIVAAAEPGIADESAVARVVATKLLQGCREPFDVETLARLLRDDDERVRDAALSATSALAKGENDSLDVLVEIAVEALSRSRDPRLAISTLGQMGPRAAKASLAIAKALARTSNAYQAGQVLVAIGALDPETEETLRAHAFGWCSSAARAAEKVLTTLGKTPPDVPLAHRLERIRRELASDDPAVRRNGFFEAGLLGPPAAPLIDALRAVGERAAADDALDAQVELRGVREAMTKLGCEPEDLPRPPSPR